MTFREERDWYRNAYETVLLLVEQLNESLIVYSGEFPDSKLSPQALADIQERIKIAQPLIEKMNQLTATRPYIKAFTKGEEATQKGDINSWLKDLFD